MERREKYYPYELIPLVPEELISIVKKGNKNGYISNLNRNKEERKKDSKARDIIFLYYWIIRDMKCGIIVYSSIISPRKLEKMESKIKNYFSRAKIAMETYLIPPRIYGRSIIFPRACYRCIWCGKLVTRTDRRYCSGLCASNYERKYNWGSIRSQVFIRDNYTCKMCGKQQNKESNVDIELQCDHILAICNGGDLFDKNNLQTLCYDCHKIKTKEDLEKREKKEKVEPPKDKTMKITEFMEG